MIKSILYTASAITLAGCGAAADPNWSDDCVRNHSETGREFAQCKEKLKRKKAEKAAKAAAAYAQEQPPKIAKAEAREIPAGQVSIDPEGTEMESFKETGKKTRGATESQDEEK